MSETFPHDENYDITVFNLEMVNIELDLNKNNDETDFIDVQFGEGHEILSVMNDTAPPILYSNIFELQNSARGDERPFFRKKTPQA